MKVLIIDDDRDIRRLAAAILSRAGDTVIEAESGAEGIGLAGCEQPDVILLDSVMPGLDGSATLARLREDPTTAAIPVIFLTGTASPEAREQLATLGVRGVLKKPFNPAKLAEAVRALLAS
jgi:CheY-like chemotaxis protein